LPYKDEGLQKLAQHEHYLRNKKYFKERTRLRRKQQRAWFQELKSKLVCSNCPEPDSICLDFHHLDPKDKSDTVSKLAAELRNKEIILKEIAKCIVLCSNCHRKLHRDEYQPVG
jgi:hypothetical protein